jgi:hypothetical protein
VPGEAEDAAIAFLLQLDPATQREVLERYEEALQLEGDSDSRRMRRIALALHEAKRTATITDYLAWQRRPDVRDRPGRRPASTWVFNRIFGGFPAARIAAGLVKGEPTAAHPSDLLLRTANYRLTAEQISDDIRFAAARIRGPVTATAYDREPRLIYQETRAAGHPRALAGVGTAYRHFRTWPAALAAAGVHDQSAEAAHPVSRRAEAQLLRALSDAHDALEGRLTVDRYVAWRERESLRQ